MKLKAPKLTEGKRSALLRTKDWMINLSGDLEKKKARLDKLNLAFETAESSKNESKKDAALNPAAALKLAGLEAQLSALAPEIEQLRRSLERETATAVRQVNLVRTTELRELLFGPLLEQIVASLADALDPFFDADWAKGNAKQMVERTNQYRQLSFYLNPPPIAAEFEDAKRGIDALVGQLNQILSGETLIEM